MRDRLGERTLRYRERGRSEERASKIGIQRNDQPLVREAPRGQAHMKEYVSIKCDPRMGGRRSIAKGVNTIGDGKGPTICWQRPNMERSQFDIIKMAEESNCSIAYIRLREPNKSEDKTEVLVVKRAEEVENVEVNSKYQDKTKGRGQGTS
ncbi:hypothetical protein BHE74_00001546 [Ensete ventricosum]|nr:hypothetical protein BHE74_00001546 [Ensete ventricosum]RZR76020.1 hypothetical protein BHM03_00000624 [Ensete ventricosum]